MHAFRIFVYLRVFRGYLPPTPKWPQKAQEVTKTAANMLECIRVEFSRIFVFFVAICHQLQIAILQRSEGRVWSI